MKKNYFLLFIGLLMINFSGSAQTGTSLNFDGVNDEVICGNDTSLQITGTAITIEARVKIVGAFTANWWQGTVMSKGNSSDGGATSGGYGLRAGGAGEASFFYGQGDSSWPEALSPANTLTLGTWHHIAGTYDGAMVRIYVDGTEVASSPSTSNIATSLDPLRIGASGFLGRNIGATIDEVRVWNVVRTPAEIDANKESELTLPQTGLVAYYKMNQGIGGGDNATETTATDELGTNNGTLNNFALNGASSNWLADSTLSTESFSLNKVSIFPIPVSNVINVKGLSQSTKYSIYNTLGQTISQGDVLTNSIDVESLKSGLYILNLENLGSIKFVK